MVRRATELFDADLPPPQWMRSIVGGHFVVVPRLPCTVLVNAEGDRLLPSRLAPERFGDVPGTPDGLLRGNVIVLEVLP